MIARVLLLKRLPRALGAFDYAVPRSLRSTLTVGNLVTVPFRGREVKGVVAALHRTTRILRRNLKPINELAYETPLATAGQLRIIRWIASYYHASPATVARTFIPLPVKQRRTPKAIVGTVPALHPPVQSARITDILQRSLGKRHKTLMLYHEERNAWWCYRMLAEEAVKNRKTLLLLFPRIDQCRTMVAALPQTMQPHVALLTGALSRGELFANYLRVIGGAPVIIGTQPAAVLPLRRVHAIVLHDEESSHYLRLDQNPRMHLRKIAVQASRHYNASLLLSSRTPSVATFYARLYKQYQPLHLIPQHAKPAAIQVINMQNERRSGNRSLFSDALSDAIAQTLAQSKQCLLLVFRRGIAGVFVCRECGHRWTCSRCGLPLRLREESLLCTQGHESIPVPLSCPVCRSVDLRGTGFGSARVEAELKIKYPDKTIVRFDADSPDVTESDLRHADIIVATSIPLQTPMLSRLACAGVLLLDSLFLRPDLSADEQTFRILVQLRESVGEAGGSTVFCQTYTPDHPVIQAVVKSAYAKWYRMLLAERKRLQYPPFAHVLRLSVQRRTKQEARKESERQYAALKPMLVRDLKLLPPSMSMEATSHLWVRYQLILKTKLDPSHRLVDALIKKLPDDWTIESDPESLA